MNCWAEGYGVFSWNRILRWQKVFPVLYPRPPDMIMYQSDIAKLCSLENLGSRK